MNIFNQLQTTPHLTTNEKQIASYILEHPEDVLKMNARDLAASCYVSMATVYRLCEKLNLAGYSELKLQLSLSYENYLKGKDFDFNFPVKQYQTHYKVMHFLKEDYDKTIQTTFDYFDLEQLRLITSAMLKAKSIDVYTSSGNIYFAENFRFQMSEIGALVKVPVDEYEQSLCAASSDQDHFAIVISFMGRGMNMERVQRILHATKTPLLLISSPEYQSAYADYQLYLNPYEDHYKKISSFSTRLSLLYILDVIYTCYFKRNYDQNLKTKLHYYKMLSEGKIT
ncbi:MAG: MurR/RpiR family transcriptional regulator [bacterium]